MLARKKTVDANKVAAVAATIESDLKSTAANLSSGFIDMNTANLSSVVDGFAKAQLQYMDSIKKLQDQFVALGVTIKMTGQHTGFEKFVAIFSANKADEMMNARIQSMGIDGSLQGMLTASDVIITNMKSDETKLVRQIEVIKTRLAALENEREEVNRNLDEASSKVKELLPKLQEVQDKIGVTTDEQEKKVLRIDENRLVNEINAWNAKEKEYLSLALTKQHSYEDLQQHLAHMYDINVAQRASIAKAEEDLKRRLITFKQGMDTRKIVANQSAYHKLETVAMKADADMREMIAGMSIAIQREHISQLETFTARNNHVTEVGDKYIHIAEEFNRRHKEMLEKFKANQ